MLAVKGYYKDGRVELIDAHGILHRMPNWTDEEWKELGLRNFLKEDDTKVEELFDV